MEFIERVLLYVFLMAVFCLLVGLVKPWIVLWWEDTQNRKKVIKLYGTAALITFALYWALVLI